MTETPAKPANTLENVLANLAVGNFDADILDLHRIAVAEAEATRERYQTKIRESWAKLHADPEFRLSVRMMQALLREQWGEVPLQMLIEAFTAAAMAGEEVQRYRTGQVN